MPTSSAWAGPADEFSCEACGSASIAVPASLHADAEVSCGRCGRFVATWSGFCRGIEGILSVGPSLAGPAGESRASAF